MFGGALLCSVERALTVDGPVLSWCSLLAACVRQLEIRLSVAIELRTRTAVEECNGLRTTPESQTT